MYNTFIYLYSAGAFLASKFNSKIKTMLTGEKKAFQILKSKVDKNQKYAWFHAASLGEFEQGRPLIEHFREEYPEYKVLLTFFSPSGYEIRKDYSGADIVCYLPLDTPKNAKKFLSIISPSVTFFIKYEFWSNYLHILKSKNVPIFCVSGIFRENQIFFKWYGKSYAKVLKCFERFFVQNDNSKQLLQSIGLNNVEITGDTRFDRVLQIQKQSKSIELLHLFSKESRVIVAGSTWADDEKILCEYLNNNNDYKFIIAPHVVTNEHIKQIQRNLSVSCVTLSQATKDNILSAKCVIIDSYGLLSSIYKYGEIAYIGGGFGAGIHNVLEAAVWSMPVIFGTNHMRFKEANDLIELKGAFEINNFKEFYTQIQTLKNNQDYLKQASFIAGNYVLNNAGAVNKIIKYLKENTFVG